MAPSHKHTQGYKSLEPLDPLEKEVLRARFFMSGNGVPMPWDQVGELLEMEANAAEQIQLRALRKLGEDV